MDIFVDIVQKDVRGEGLEEGLNVCFCDVSPDKLTGERGDPDRHILWEEHTEQFEEHDRSIGAVHMQIREQRREKGLEDDRSPGLQCTVEERGFWRIRTGLVQAIVTCNVTQQLERGVVCSV